MMSASALAPAPPVHAFPGPDAIAYNGTRTTYVYDRLEGSAAHVYAAAIGLTAYSYDQSRHQTAFDSGARPAESPHPTTASPTNHVLDIPTQHPAPTTHQCRKYLSRKALNNQTQPTTRTQSASRPKGRWPRPPLAHHWDHRYSVQAISDQSGAVIERYSYSAYGEWSVTDALGNPVAAKDAKQPYGYTGREYDAETKLYYFRARYFDSEKGWFVSRDPLRYIDGYSMYRGYFVPNALDPHGLVIIKKLGKTEDYCGKFSQTWEFHLPINLPSEQDAWIVQKVTRTTVVAPCNFTDPAQSVETTYWEAFRIGPGQNVSWQTDTFGRHKELWGTIGTDRVVGELRFYWGIHVGDDIKGWGHQVGAAGQLYSTTTRPKFWADFSAGEPYRVHWVTARWNCCHIWCDESSGNFYAQPVMRKTVIEKVGEWHGYYARTLEGDDLSPPAADIGW